jgi:hypothetical protein
VRRGDASLPTGAGGPPVTEADIAGLPSTVQRYLRFMQVVGRPRDWSLRVGFRGRFRIRPGRGWLPADAWQYNSAVQPARIFVMRLRLGHLVPFYGRDTYVRRRGHMVGTLFGRTVVDGSGTEFDHSELVIYLNDAILLPPSMLLNPATCWTAVDDDSFDVALTDRGPTVCARVRVDQRGAPTDFAADRYATLPQGLVLAPWHTPIQRWEGDGDRPVPGPAPVCLRPVDRAVLLRAGPVHPREPCVQRCTRSAVAAVGCRDVDGRPGGQPAAVNDGLADRIHRH